MGKKPHKKAAGNRSARMGTKVTTDRAERKQGGAGVPPALARNVASVAPASAVPALAALPKSAPVRRDAAKTVGGGAAILRVDEEQPAARGCLSAALAGAEPQGLAATYSFEVPESGGPYSGAIRFVGTRVRVLGKPDPGDRFERIEGFDGLEPGSGRAAITTRALGINPGEWRVTAMSAERSAAPTSMRLPRRVISTATTFGQLAQGPAVRLAAWPTLVGMGAVVAVVFQALLAGRAGIDVAAVLVMSLIGCILGFVGGKAYYLVLHHKHPRQFLSAGACIQGFLLVALGVIAVGAAALGIPIGVLLDTTAPGVFLGMAVGRPGCWLTGCCAGRPTSSRWGMWSSDRRLATRRFPVQLLEAAAALVIGAVSLILVLTTQPSIAGVIFVGAVAAYTFSRQLLFPLRTESRTRIGRSVTMVFCGVVLAATVSLPILA
ncbi:prolipoprotein diacylglyceryl transferase family protein [Prauserella flavalba]|uniref:prolipoprotein diacylglyceryl transferase family protein n=1 Tax=Prauserella flavalba TaxID=1477506 RepID=UPI001AEF66B0|nr:prolipoprotein diacylglyceryl transferase family protein [Prauserella flavalba]